MLLVLSPLLTAQTAPLAHSPEGSRNRSVLLATSESEISEWNKVCAEAEGSEDKRWEKLGTVYDLGDGVVGVVARSVFDPGALSRRATVLGDLAGRIRKTRKAHTLEELGPETGQAVRDLILSGSTPQAIAAMSRKETEIGFQLTVQYILDVPGYGTLTVDADPKGLEPRVAAVTKTAIDQAIQSEGPTLLDTHWSWRPHARLHFHRTGDLENQFRLAARLFEVLEPEAAKSRQEVLSSATALNEALRTATGLDIRGGTTEIPASDLSADARTLLLERLRTLQTSTGFPPGKALPPGLSANEVLSRATVRSIRVRPSLIVETEFQGNRERFVRELSFH
ncbi:MAG: hypothetical protein KF884_04335 [Fimbriimonadaceae bacterium]|nr:hypothetical protein [Fimbriimonadaceae bacterium]QYK59318.1 MAG: hypothetical protein KF884_04335 [Fimbriimonadaceae bacterium]